MIKRMAMMARRPADDMTTFNHYWLHTHGALVRESPGVLRYQQNPVLETLHCAGARLLPYRLDGLVELWFRNEDEMHACFASPGGRQLPDDEERFLSMITRHDVWPAAQPHGEFKLLLAASGARSGARLASLAGRLTAALDQPAATIVHNAVRGILSRPNLPAEDVPADAFVQILLDGDEAQARAALRRLAVDRELRRAGHGFDRLGAYLLQERRVVQ